jgi:cytochrome c oxidase subunit 2
METVIPRLLHLPPVASAHGAQVDRLLFYVHLLMFTLFIGWSLFFLYSLWRFRVRRHPRPDPAGVRSHWSSYLEVGVAVTEAFLLVAFAIPIWARSAAAGNFPSEKESTVVRIIGRQFNWIARYAGPDGVFGRADAALISAQNPLGIDPGDAAGLDDIVVDNSEIVVPVDKPVIAHVSSLDVIHSFSVKPLRVTQDAVPGLSIPIWFKPTVAGTYQINCAQLCGNGHANMRGVLKVVSAAEYEDFVRAKARAGRAAASYE